MDYSNKVTAIEVSPQSMQVSNSAIVTTFLGRVVKKKTRYFTARLIVRGQLGVSDLASGLKMIQLKIFNPKNILSIELLEEEAFSHFRAFEGPQICKRR